VNPRSYRKPLSIRGLRAEHLPAMLMDVANSHIHPPGPCAWRDDPEGSPCARKFARRTWVRELLEDGEWRWADMPLCWTHYGRLRRNNDGTCLPRNAVLTREQFEEAQRRSASGESVNSIAIALGADSWTLGRRLREGYDSGTPLIPEEVRQAANALRPVKRRKRAAGRPRKKL
jgi:hypothetical protein